MRAYSMLRGILVLAHSLKLAAHKWIWASIAGRSGKGEQEHWASIGECQEIPVISTGRGEVEKWVKKKPPPSLCEGKPKSYWWKKKSKRRSPQSKVEHRNPSKSEATGYK